MLPTDLDPPTVNQVCTKFFLAAGPSAFCLFGTVETCLISSSKVPSNLFAVIHAVGETRRSHDSDPLWYNDVNK